MFQFLEGNQEELSQIIENQVFNMILPNSQKGITIQEYPGALLRKTPVSHFLTNIICWTKPPIKDLVQSTLTKIVKELSSEKKSFGVFLNDPELHFIADSLGMKKLASYFSVLCEDTNIPDELFKNIKKNIRIQGTTDIDQDSFSELLTQCFEMPSETARFLVEECYFNKGKGLPVRNYIAFIEGEEEPIGFASTLDYPTRSAYAMLGGSGVLKEHRGKGVYKALLARRVQDIKVDGKKKLICMADEKTSAPILKKNGFSQISTHFLYGFLSS